MQLSKTDTEIINQLVAGSFEAFDYLYAQYHKAVFNNIFKFIRRSDIAEDLLQDVFVSLWENREKMDSARDAGGWLFVVSYNKSIAYLREKVREKIVFTENINEIILSHEVENTETRELHLSLLNNAVDALSPRKKTAFQLCRLQGKSYAEAAGLLGVSTETVKGYMKESFKFIREFIASHYTGASYFLVFLICSYSQYSLPEFFGNNSVIPVLPPIFFFLHI